MTPEQFAYALALTESNNNAEAWGDGGRAMGAYQTHPAWLIEKALNLKVNPTVSDTWHDYQTRVVIAFFRAWSTLATPVEIAMFFHVGHPTQAHRSDWDAPYAEKFQSNAAIVLQGQA